MISNIHISIDFLTDQDNIRYFPTKIQNDVRCKISPGEVFN